MKKQIESEIKKIGVRAAIAAVWIAVWQIAHALIGKSLILPSPWETLTRLIALLGTSGLWLTVGATLLRILSGLCAGMVFGCLMGAITYANRHLRKLFAPLLTIAKTTPVASFIILALVLIPTSAVPSFTVFIIVTPVFWTNIFTGAGAVDTKLLEMARMYRFGRKTLLRRVYVPSLVPYFTSALTTGIGLAWKSGIAAEVLCVSKNSIGSELYESKIYLETVDLFAWTAIVIIISVILENAVTALIRKSSTDRRHAG